MLSYWQVNVFEAFVKEERFGASYFWGWVKSVEIAAHMESGPPGPLDGSTDLTHYQFFYSFDLLVI